MHDESEHKSPSKLALVAAGTALLAAGNAIAARRAERRYRPEGRLLDVDGVRVHVIERGEGRPVVLLHGNVVTATDWIASGVVDQLQRDHRVILIDRPGYGHSGRPRDRVWTPATQARLLRSTLRQLGVERPVLAGHSLGAVVAVAYALAFPEALSGLVLLSGYYFPGPRVDALMTSLVALPAVGDVLRYTVSPLLGRASFPALFAQMFAPMEVPERFLASFPYGLVVRPSQIRAISEDGTLMVPAVAELAPRYGELHRPIPIFSGDGDKIVGLETHAERMAEVLPEGRLIRIRGAGHMVHYAAPDRVAEAIRGAI